MPTRTRSKTSGDQVPRGQRPDEDEEVVDTFDTVGEDDDDERPLDVRGLDRDEPGEEDEDFEDQESGGAGLEIKLVGAGGSSGGDKQGRGGNRSQGGGAGGRKKTAGGTKRTSTSGARSKSKSGSSARRGGASRRSTGR